MEVISKLFSPSPFRYLHEHAKETGACLRCLQLQIEAALSEDRESVDGHFREIQSHLRVGRVIADDAFELLSTRVAFSVCREDLVSTLNRQILMLCACGELSSLVSARSLSLHRDIGQEFGTYAREVLELASAATDVVSEVDALAEVGFGGPEADRVELLVDEMQRRIAIADLFRNGLLQSLAAHESETSSFEHSICLRLISGLGHIATLADILARQFRLFVTPHSDSPNLAV